MFKGIIEEMNKESTQKESKESKGEKIKEISHKIKKEIHDYSKVIIFKHFKSENEETTKKVEKCILKVLEDIKINISKNGLSKGRDLETEVSVSLYYTFDLFTGIKDILSGGQLKKMEKDGVHWFQYENLKNGIDLDEDGMIALFCKWVNG